MARELTVFLSSTVEGLKAVREEIAELLRARKVVVRQSEESGFPIEPGITSHDACVRAVEGAHVCIVLIATRFGDDVVDEEGKSISWAEYDAARAAGAYPIVLIREDMNALAIEIYKARRDLRKAHPAESDVQLDTRLRTMPEFRDFRRVVQNLPAQQRFIDAVRKGHVDNWVHNDWKGTTAHAMELIDARLATLLASTSDKYTELNTRAGALMQVTEAAVLLQSDVVSGLRNAGEALGVLVQLTASLRKPLFGFADSDRYNVALFQRDKDDTYRIMSRRSHRDIERHDRVWKLGEGQVGAAAQAAAPLITPDLTASTSRTTHPAYREKDEANYRSVVSVPVLQSGGKAQLVLTISTSRKNHFHDAQQSEVLTAVTVGHIFGTIWLVGGRIARQG